MTVPLRYDAACKAIAEAKSVDEVTEWVDKAAAVREYGRRIKNRQLEIDAIEIRVRAKKRRGELVLQLKEQGRIRDGRKKQSPEDDRLTLEDLGISKNESSEEQAIAKIDGGAYERLVARCRAYAEQHPEKHSFDILKPPPEGGPINGARSLMGSRVEDEESLDYFPTPPWATRALLRHVFPALGLQPERMGVAWEPACGEGHIAEVLADYADRVIATDIHEWGYGEVLDFLGEHPPGFAADWLITNPPFLKKTEAFVDRSLEIARAGVAMFVRMQWLETKGRYERIFRDRPPTMIAFFAERVPLCKGEWKPEGDTATAYVWLVWLKGRAPQAPFWIPPDCREDLTLPDDAERFTTKPVTKRERPVDGSGEQVKHDPESGEVIESPDAQVIAQPSEERSALLKPSSSPDDDDLEIPAFLRKPRAEARA